MTKVEKSVTVKVPISTVYSQWTQFEDFPQFMGGVTSVTQLGDDRLQWVAQIGGVKRQWEARVLEQVPDRKVAWAATEGATNAGEVTFEASGPERTTVNLVLEYEPNGFVEQVGDKLGFVGNQAKTDLKKFKKFIEDKGYATGAWRGSVNAGAGVGQPTVEHADSSRGDAGKAGVSATSIAGWLALASGVAAAVFAALKSRSNKTEVTTVAPDPTALASSTQPREVGELSTSPVVDVDTDTHGGVDGGVDGGDISRF